MSALAPDDPTTYNLPIEDQLPLFVDQHREMLVRSLEGLTEDEARQQLVKSSTTLLGLVKHATFVERVWFEETVAGQPRAESGIEADPEDSFLLTEHDTISSVLDDHRSAVTHAQGVVDRLGLDAIVTGNRRGDLPMRWILLHVLRELAQHCGHADILREQVLATRT